MVLCFPLYCHRAVLSVCCDNLFSGWNPLAFAAGPSDNASSVLDSTRFDARVQSEFRLLLMRYSVLEFQFWVLKDKISQLRVERFYVIPCNLCRIGVGACVAVGSAPFEAFMLVRVD